MVIHQRDDGLGGVNAGDILDDREVEDLLAGRLGVDPAGRQALVAFVAALRAAASAPPPVRADLAAIFEARPVTPDCDVSSIVGRSSRRRRMLSSFSVFVATLTGKAVLSAVAVAVTVGGAQATGVIDVPGLPEVAQPADGDGPAAPGNPAPESEGDGSEADKSHSGEGHGDSARLDGPGVDGGEISDRARGGEPREDGREFGDDVSDEARDGTPGEGLPGDRGEVAEERRPGDTPVGAHSRLVTPARAMMNRARDARMRPGGYGGQIETIPARPSTRAAKRGIERCRHPEMAKPRNPARQSSDFGAIPPTTQGDSKKRVSKSSLSVLVAAATMTVQPATAELPASQMPAADAMTAHPGSVVRHRTRASDRMRIPIVATILLTILTGWMYASRGGSEFIEI